MIKRSLLALCLFATPMAAETEVDAFRLGHHKPQPEAGRKVAGLYTFRARIVNAKTGDLADAAVQGAKLRLDLSFMATKGAADRDLRLLCRVQFMDAAAVSSEFKKEAVCFDGKLSEAAAGYTSLDMPLTFKPSSKDPKGTSGVRVRVTDEATGESYLMVPTYDWQGGRE